MRNSVVVCYEEVVDKEFNLVLKISLPVGEYETRYWSPVQHQFISEVVQIEDITSYYAHQFDDGHFEFSIYPLGHEEFDFLVHAQVPLVLKKAMQYYICHEGSPYA